MDTRKLKIAIVVHVMPSYREGFYSRLFARRDLFVKVYCQESIPGSNLKTIHSKYPNNVTILKSFTAKGEKIAWQFIPWRKCLSDYDVVFVHGNPRYLSHAMLATVMRLMRKKIVLWMMAHSFRANEFTESIRLYWSRIFNYLFVYSDTEVSFLRKKGFEAPNIMGMNNGLDQKMIDASILMWPENKLNVWRQEHNFENKIILLSCARLGPKNKFKQFVQALPEIVDEFPTLLWCVIGSGSEQAELESMISAAGLIKHVRFVGELYDENALAPWFLSSEIFIHPASIGLSLLHAFGYGLPVVTHSNWEHHNPEYCAFEQGFTGRNFNEDDIESLSDTVISLLRDYDARKKIKGYVKRVARENYNVDVMVERFIHIAQLASGK